MKVNPEQELAYNVEQCEVWNALYPTVNFKPYTGPFKHLDLTETWFCPRCRDISKPLVLGSSKLTLFCPSNAYKCEYSYSNFEERKKRKSFLSEGYSLPMSLNDVTKHTITQLQKEKESNLKKKQDLETRNDEIHNHIIKLTKTLV
ncbi:hypothetical protein [Photobacterium phage PDCC-1]|uniref:Uncharacterized protein n=1 Tax=Photobacterium phage PDCC-1 TaxID=2664246 RepID=A0A6B9J217_9CAUD|nr:hypothetical protein HWC77_gp001 [Photobacterium phage PDCC-1]QGZ14364.1 hypothetical protein [Photobacterium phage PDCC-1]